MPAPFRYDRRFEFDLPPGELWEVLARTDDYPGWWPWLRAVEPGARSAAAATALVDGTIARCAVRAPLPYTLHFDVTIDRVEPATHVDASVRGDLDGPARLELTPSERGGSWARLVWSLELRDRLLRPLALLTRPAMVWAHDRVIEAGLRDFERRALDRDRP
jgi:hypothetical protein